MGNANIGDMRILIIDDDPSLAQVIKTVLEREGFICDTVALGEDGLEYSRIYPYDIIILDLILPDMHGFEVLKFIRNSSIDIPVLILSSIGDSEKKIKGLGFGADDYLSKPFENQELVARVKAIVRRVKGHSVSEIQIDEICVDLNQHKSFFKKDRIDFTRKEQNVIEVLALNKGKAISKEVIMNQIYNGIDEPDFKIIDVFICKIRRKLQSLSNKNYIQTVWGRGYMLIEPEQY